METVLNKLYGTVYPAPLGLDNAIESVYRCFRDTVVQRRGQQRLVLGARATGKTLVVHEALKRATAEFGDQFILIKINGVSHGDEKLALREIAKQLDACIDNADENIEMPSLSRTLRGINRVFEASPASNRQKCVVFIVEEFDRYVAAHQVLAYELLDWSQSSGMGVAVVGTSTRLNIMDLLEKRNRSRNTAIALTLPKPSSVNELEAIGMAFLENSDNQEFMGPKILSELAEQVFYTSNSARSLASLLVPYVLGIEPDIMQPLYCERLLQPLDALPELDLALIACAARAVVRYDTQSVNLVIVLDEWRALADATQASRFAESTHVASFPRPGSTPSSLLAVRHAWERLKQLGLLEPSQAGTQEDLRMYVPELDLDDMRELLPRDHALYGWTNIEA